MQTSIIILTYNSEKYIEPLISSIFQHNKGQSFEIIVVDNNSKDETIKKVRSSEFARREELRIIETGENLGFAKGINVGAAKAEGEFLLFVNPDTFWIDGTIKELVNVFDRSDKIGIVGGKLINSVVPEKSAGKFFGFWASLLLALGLDEAFGIRFSPNKTIKTDFVSGGFMMVKKKVFDTLGGFDENYFIYVEDMDICFRAKKLGFSTYFTPNASLMHDSHGSSSRGFAIKNIYKGILYFQKNHKSIISFHLVKLVLYLKATALVMVGKIINNKYLTETYQSALKSL